MTEIAIEDVAKIAHEVNRAWCEYNEDMSQERWEDAPEWQRKSAINGAAFHRENPSAGNDNSHNSWMAEKLADGWKYGPVKNPDTKEHPCIVPFSELPRDQQFKDQLFRTICRAAFD